MIVLLRLPRVEQIKTKDPQIHRRWVHEKSSDVLGSTNLVLKICQ